MFWDDLESGRPVTYKSHDYVPVPVSTEFKIAMANQRLNDKPIPTLMSVNVSLNNYFIKNARLAAIEFLALLTHIYRAEVSNHSRLLTLFHHAPNGPQHVAIYDKHSGIAVNTGWHQKPMVPLKYKKMFVGGQFVDFDPGRLGLNYALVTKYCQDALDCDILKSCQNMSLDFVPRYVDFTQAGPGCGKTMNILEEHLKVPRALVILSTTEARNSFRQRVQALNPSLTREELRTSYRTMASVLINGITGSFTHLYIDEAMMHHPGAITLAINKVKAPYVSLIGDILQIPFVNKAPMFPVLRSRLTDICSPTRVRGVTTRCPVDVAYRLSPIYRDFHRRFGFNVGLKSTNPLFDTCRYQRINSLSDVPVANGVQYLTFTHPEALLLNSLGITNVKTVHEFQGSQAKNIVVVRLNIYSTYAIFDDIHYAIVALSRHTESLRYYTLATCDDALTKLIATTDMAPYLAPPNVIRDYLQASGNVDNKNKIEKVSKQRSIEKHGERQQSPPAIPEIPDSLKAREGCPGRGVRYYVDGDLGHEVPDLHAGCGVDCVHRVHTQDRLGDFEHSSGAQESRQRSLHVDYGPPDPIFGSGLFRTDDNSGTAKGAADICRRSRSVGDGHSDHDPPDRIRRRISSDAFLLA